jgi:hypothetical protein
VLNSDDDEGGTDPLETRAFFLRVMRVGGELLQGVWDVISYCGRTRDIFGQWRTDTDVASGRLGRRDILFRTVVGRSRAEDASCATFFGWRTDSDPCHK